MLKTLKGPFWLMIFSFILPLCIHMLFPDYRLSPLDEPGVDMVITGIFSISALILLYRIYKIKPLHREIQIPLSMAVLSFIAYFSPLPWLIVSFIDSKFPCQQGMESLPCNWSYVLWINLIVITIFLISFGMSIYKALKFRESK